MIKANIDYDQNRVDSIVDAMMTNGLEKLGEYIQKRTIVLEPVASGNLRRSTTMESTSKTVTVTANTPYARRRHYENYKNPSTKYYMTNAIKSVGDVQRFFK